MSITQIAANDHSTAFLGRASRQARNHTLVVPHRHVGSIFELGSEEQGSIWNLVADIRNRLKAPMRHQTLRPGPMNVRTDSATSLSSLPRRQRLAEVACEQISRPKPLWQIQIADDRVDGEPFLRRLYLTPVFTRQSP